MSTFTRKVCTVCVIALKLLSLCVERDISCPQFTGTQVVSAQVSAEEFLDESFPVLSPLSWSKTAGRHNGVDVVRNLPRNPRHRLLIEHVVHAAMNIIDDCDVRRTGRSTDRRAPASARRRKGVGPDV